MIESADGGITMSWRTRNYLPNISIPSQTPTFFFWSMRQSVRCHMVSTVF